MKKFIAMIVLIAFSVLLVGCSSDNNVTIKNKTLRNRFIKVESDSAGYSIYVDVETNVMYLAMRHNVDQLGLTVLVDSDGKPLLYSGNNLHYNQNFIHSVN